ncbi:MAG TPA: PAS domain S-box protein, partial [Candidatus Eisenbacteria bacterium]|nr:PAS domain S-box protein [Candidatus Eisenbacteria bacterium]
EKGIIQTVNPAVERIFGYASQELMGRNVSMLMPHPYDREHDGYIAQYLRTGRAKIIGIGREVVGRRKDGSEFPIYLGVSEGRKKGRRRFFTGVIRDLTDRRHLEQMVREISRKEQVRIGQELHDGLAQHLATTAIMAKVLEKKLQRSPSSAARDLKRVVGMINQAITQTRELAQGLYALEMHGDIVDAIRVLARDTEKTVGIRCSFEAEGPVTVSDATAVMHLYRIAREAVNNAVKHGGGKNIWIRLRRKGPREAELRIENDGKPFVKPTARQKGLGMRILSSRAAILKATLNIGPRPKGGAVVNCVFPLS